MTTTSAATPDAAYPATKRPASTSSSGMPELATSPSRRARPSPTPQTDDEILGLTPAPQKISAQNGIGTQDDSNFEPKKSPGNRPDAESSPGAAEPEELRGVLDANPELRAAWEDAQAYRETFATPQEARKATALLADLDRMDALFFSSRPEDHTELARAVAALDPAAFASLAQAMGRLAQNGGGNAAQAGPDAGRIFRAEGLAAGSSGNNTPNAPDNSSTPSPLKRQATSTPQTDQQDASGTETAATAQAQSEFFHAANAATVQGVIDSIESQVDRLLPEGISKSARNRVVGEIYRELDVTLRSNRQLAQQMREAFRSGSLDADHQRAIVSLITGRARQALPAVAKRVLNEWTSTLVAAGQERRSRQRTAERRVDIAGSSGAGNDGRRSMSPREIDYARMSDSDILNL